MVWLIEYKLSGIYSRWYSLHFESNAIINSWIYSKVKIYFDNIAKTVFIKFMFVWVCRLFRKYGIYFKKSHEFNILSNKLTFIINLSVSSQSSYPNQFLFINLFYIFSSLTAAFYLNFSYKDSLWKFSSRLSGLATPFYEFSLSIIIMVFLLIELNISFL